MHEPLSLDDLVRWLARQWRWVGAACLTAAVIAGGVSASVPKQYTAVSRLIMETGPRSPLRNATAETPQLLARLAGYEQLVRSDSLFADVARRTGLDAARTLEDWKREGLATQISGQARVLEIRFTHTNPHKAHEVALALAEETVRWSEEARQSATAQLVAEADEKHEDARSWMIYRGEYLRLLDAGIDPQRPSSPRLLLNVMGAVLFAFASSSAVLLIRYATGARR
jgi:uncharacterized protein involved in exopolysaccharide biosynthesis